MARKMKSSGIEWIGDIPEDWEVIKVKYTHDAEKPNSFVDGDWIESNYISDSGIRYLTTGNIGDGVFKEQGDGFVSEANFDLLKCKYAYPGDLIFARLNAPYGRSCLLPDTFDKYVIAVDNVILRPAKGYNKRFINYITQCPGYQKSVEDFASGTTMQRISRVKLGNVQLPMPKSIEQTKIADFLDKKTNQIEQIKTAVQQEIQTLENYKKSVITEAVTKGLDKNAAMKDSGIEWIGDIPKYWEVKKIKYLAQILNGSTPSTTDPEFWDGDIKWVTPKDLYNNTFIEDSIKKITQEGYLSCGTNMVPINTILLSTRAPVGQVAIAKTQLCTNQGIKSIVCDQRKMHYKFLYYFLLVNDKLLNAISNGTTFLELSTSSLLNLVIPYTSVSEQREIVNYLNEECEKIDFSIVTKQKQLETLEEYKKSLIYEYVTGKKEVAEC